MKNPSPIALATARGAAVAFALSAGGLLVYREHVRAQPLEAIGEATESQTNPEQGNSPFGYLLDPAGTFLNSTPVDYEVPPGLPELELFHAYPSDFLYSSKSMPFTLISPAPAHNEAELHEATPPEKP